MDFCKPDHAVKKLDRCEAFEFAPPIGAELPAYAVNLSNITADCDSLNIGYLRDKVKFRHAGFGSSYLFTDQAARHSSRTNAWTGAGNAMA